jgi:ribose 5-phosphate isomerase B
LDQPRNSGTARPLLSAKEVQAAIASGSHRIFTAPGTLITPMARDLAASNGIEILVQPAAAEPPAPGHLAPAPEPDPVASKVGKTVAFGADHGGFQLKQMLIKHAESLGYTVLDLGTSNEESCDYPDFAFAVARAVASGEAWRGIMIDGAGIGSCVVANKVPGIRAACCHNEFVARNAREHNDTNVLTLGSRVTGSEVCKEIMKVWLETWFAGGRHKARVDKMTDVERRYLK